MEEVNKLFDEFEKRARAEGKTFFSCYDVVLHLGIMLLNTSCRLRNTIFFIYKMNQGKEERCNY